MSETTTTPAAWFVAIFRELVVALQPRGLERAAIGIYFAVLQAFPESVVREAAERLQRRSTFFPSTGEWHAEACHVAMLTTRPSCPHCAGRGLIAVRYRSGEPFDVALCDCPAASPFRVGGERLVRAVLRLDDPAHRVADRSAFVEATAMQKESGE